MKNGDKPAFQDSIISYPGGGNEHCFGLTKREYFAAMAMQSMVAGNGARMVADIDKRYNGTNWKQVVAWNAIEFADELIKQLEQ